MAVNPMEWNQDELRAQAARYSQIILECDNPAIVEQAKEAFEIVRLLLLNEPVKQFSTTKKRR